MWLERCLDGEEGEFMLNWPSMFKSVPRILPRPRQGIRMNGNGNGNGHMHSYANGLNGSSKKAL